LKRYDAVIVGAGAGGGIAAMVLAERGARVLLIERGRWLDFNTTGRDHLRNHRLSLYGHNTGPELEGNPRVYVSPTGKETKVRPHEGGWNNVASGVGSGTVVYGGQAWRFHPLDFRMASTYGVPEGSSLADWPISHDELAPHYEAVEWAVGVSGGAAHPGYPDRRDYPMPAFPFTKKGRTLRAGAEKLGWETRPVPLLINSIPNQGRDACAACQHCVGFACPVDAKNGTHNTAIPRAMATGNCDVMTHAVVTKVEKSGSRVTGVRVVVDGEETLIEADTVVLAASAIETARLMLLSDLGNEHDQVGRNLQGHYYAVAWGLMPDPVQDGVGPGASISTTRFSHGNEGIVGGGMLADDFVVLPVVFAKWFQNPAVPKWGKGHKDWMRYAYRRFLTAMGPVHEIPHPDCRVTLDPSVKDKYGLPVARLSGTTHPETVRATEFMVARAKEWLIASGCEEVFSSPQELHLSAGQHQAGTCRMGDDPRTSVVDRNGKVHGMENLYVADGSVHVTNGGFNPVLTIMANAHRTAGMVGL
jgi:choline dehydrogenase-like flavoprotein